MMESLYSEIRNYWGASDLTPAEHVAYLGSVAILADYIAGGGHVDGLTDADSSVIMMDGGY